MEQQTEPRDEHEATLEENVQSLIGMGLEDEEQIRRVLEECGNDFEAALQVLLPDPERQNSYDMETHVDSSDSDRDSTTVSYSLEDERIREVDDSMEYRRDDSIGEERPRPQHDEKLPSYDEVVDEHKVLPGSEGDPAPDEDIEEAMPQPVAPADRSNSCSNIEFPLTHFYELEGRVHTDQWSIPYRKEESLGKCLLASIAMMNEGTHTNWLTVYLG